MTCIAGLVSEGKVYLAGDHQTSKGWLKKDSVRSKVFKKGEFVFGGTGTVRDAQILEHLFSIPKRTEGQEEWDYLMNTFVPVLAKTFRDNKKMRTENGLEQRAFKTFLTDKNLFKRISQGNYEKLL